MREADPADNKPALNDFQWLTIDEIEDAIGRRYYSELFLHHESPAS